MGGTILHRLAGATTLGAASVSSSQTKERCIEGRRCGEFQREEPVVQRQWRMGGSKMKREVNWTKASWAALALGLAACGGGGTGDAPAPAPPVGATPTPGPAPSPTPTPTPTPASFVGAVYVGTNNFGELDNFVVAFGQAADGRLTPIGVFTTEGEGRGVIRNAEGPIRLNPLISEDSLLAVDSRYLLVVNAGSNTLTSFRINGDFSLTRVGEAATGGTSPVSIAYHDSLIYVANADADGTFTGPPDQSGNLSGLRIDLSTGQLTPIANSSRDLGVRPADVEFTPDGRHLIVSGLNAGSASLAGGSRAEISSYGVSADGSLSASPQGTAISTQPGNAAGRNLPNPIGIETFARMGRQFVVATESRTAPASGQPGSFATLQTGSISTWEIGMGGALIARVQDFLLGPSATAGASQAGWIAMAPDTSVFWVSSATGAAIFGFGMSDDGTIGNSDRLYDGAAAMIGAPSPLANADGFVDLAVSGDGRYLYQLVGLKGGVNVFEVDTLVAFNIDLRQEVRTGLLPMDNLQGIVTVSRR
jgi:hypothetical protein